jgi:hypothetical protein
LLSSSEPPGCYFARKLYLSGVYFLGKLTPTPPKDWDNIRIGELSFELPKSKYKKIGGAENHIYFIGETGTIVISDLTPSKELMKVVEEKNLKYPLVDYQEQIATLKSSPADISFFKSRSTNEQSATNQILKAVSIPFGGFREINIVNPKILKAIIIKSEYRDKYGFSANISIYSQNEAASFSFMLKDYRNEDSFDADLLRILGGIKMPNHQLDPVTVKNDIAQIVRKNDSN